MRCPTCQQAMQERNGSFGKFMFCPNQAVCKQKTISEASWHQPQSEDLLRRDTGQDLMLEADLLEAQLGPLFTPSDEPFVNCLGDEIDVHGELVEHWRPY